MAQRITRAQASTNARGLPVQSAVTLAKRSNMAAHEKTGQVAPAGYRIATTRYILLIYTWWCPASRVYNILGCQVLEHPLADDLLQLLASMPVDLDENADDAALPLPLNGTALGPQDHLTALRCAHVRPIHLTTVMTMATARHHSQSGDRGSRSAVRTASTNTDAHSTNAPTIITAMAISVSPVAAFGFADQHHFLHLVQLGQPDDGAVRQGGGAHLFDQPGGQLASGVGVGAEQDVVDDVLSLCAGHGAHLHPQARHW